MAKPQSIPTRPAPESIVLAERLHGSYMRLFGVIETLKVFGDVDDSYGRVLELLAADVEREIEILDAAEAFLRRLSESKKAVA